MITEAGPVKILTDCEDGVPLDSIKRRVEISVEKHRSRYRVVVGHFDCAGNPVSKETQIEQILKSIKTVRSWHFKAEILGLWVDENWKVHEIKENGERALAQNIIPCAMFHPSGISSTLFRRVPPLQLMKAVRVRRLLSLEGASPSQCTILRFDRDR